MNLTSLTVDLWFTFLTEYKVLFFTISQHLNFATPLNCRKPINGKKNIQIVPKPEKSMVLVAQYFETHIDNFLVAV